MFKVYTQRHTHTFYLEIDYIQNNNKFLQPYECALIINLSKRIIIFIYFFVEVGRFSRSIKSAYFSRCFETVVILYT